MLESIGNPTVLSLFGGIEAFRVVLDRIGIVPKAYYSSEFDPYPIKVSSENYPDIVHVGDVTKVSYGYGTLKSENGEFEVPHIDILAGGPPCTNLSIAGKRQGLGASTREEYESIKAKYESIKNGSIEITEENKDECDEIVEFFKKTQSHLFWEFVRVFDETKPDMILVENVASMSSDAKRIISEALGIEPVMINSALVSAQNRKRLYWVGIRNSDGTYSTVSVPQPEDRGILLKDVLEPIPLMDDRWKPLDEKYVGKVKERLKAFALTATYANVCPQNHIKCDRTVILGQFRRTDLRVHADQENSPTLTANMGTGGNNVPVVIEPYCLNPQVDGKQPSLADRIYHDEAKSTAVTTCFVTNVIAAKNVNRHVKEDGSRTSDSYYPMENRVEPSTCPEKSHTVTTFDKDASVIAVSDEPKYYWRKLTVREVARLQTFPDSFTFGSVSASRAYKGFGNSWNVETAARIALTLFKEYDETFSYR